ncbi:MAG: hypothetical protein ABIJ86_04890 [Spirochaetota bacterium]
MMKTIAFIAVLCMGSIAFAQDDPAAGGTGFGFQAGISLGTDIITDSAGNPETWNNLGFKPDLSIGPFGIGFDFTMRFKLMPDPDTAFEAYPGDWVPDYEDSGKRILDLYLPKIMYVRYGQRGDPLFVKLGSIDDLTLGNGFLVGNYSNTRFLPELRIFGLNVGVDGQLFNFPFVGVEALTGNLARFDVFGTRLFVRPLITTSIPILKDMQVGATIAVDLDPETFVASTDQTGLDSIAISGADIFVPIIKSELFPLAAFMELGFQPQGRSGFMLGAGGRALGFITYGAQLRLLGAGFIPVYFDANYDLYRAAKAAFMEQDPADLGLENFAGWLAKAGTSFFDDKIYFEVSVDGPFAGAEAGSTFQGDYPHLRGVAGLREGVLGGFFFDLVYEKYMLGMENAFFADLVDPNNAVITAAVNYQSGAAIFTLLYNLRYDPAINDFNVTSSLVTTIQF